MNPTPFRSRPNEGFAMTFNNNVTISVIPSHNKQYAEVRITKPSKNKGKDDFSLMPEHIYEDGIRHNCSTDDVARLIRWAREYNDK